MAQNTMYVQNIKVACAEGIKYAGAGLSTTFEVGGALTRVGGEISRAPTCGQP